MKPDKARLPGRLNRRPVSPLTLKILGVNIGALIMLAFGFLYTAQYEHQLIETELNALNQEAKLVAAALSEGGVREQLDSGPVLARDLAQFMVRKISAEADFRIILFNSNGDLIADSHRLSGAGGVVQIFELPPPAYMQPWHARFQKGLNQLLKLLPFRMEFEEFPATDVESIQSFPHMIETIQGESAQRAWYDEDNNILISVTRPVARVKQVLGGLMLVRTGERIDQAINSVQINVLRVFFATLAITIFLSIYLSATIASPIRRLSQAADKMRLSRHDAEMIPDLSKRNDEIGDLSVSLRELTEDLNTKLVAIEAFAADVAHEIKNPLASMQSAVETLARAKDDKTRAKLETILHEDVVRLDRLITDISAASRLDAELNRVEKDPIDLSGYLKTMVDNYNKRKARKHNISFTSSAPQGHAVILGNTSRLEQVFSNIIDNALSFAPEGSGVRVAVALEKGLVCVHIENDGPSIPENKLETIFNRFYTERPGENNFGRHSGLGLSISKQIMQAHKGDIHASNLKDNNNNETGVRFTLTFPAYYD